MKNYKLFPSLTSYLKILSDSTQNIIFDNQLMFWVNVGKFRIKYIVKKKIYLKHFTNLYKDCTCRFLKNKISVIETLQFQEKHFLGFMQESIKKIDILVSFCSDHFPIFMYYKKSQDISLGKHFWKFSNLLFKMINTYLR